MRKLLSSKVIDAHTLHLIRFFLFADTHVGCSVHDRPRSDGAEPVATWSDAALTHGRAFRRRMISRSSASEIDSNVTVISSRPFFLLQCTVVRSACAAHRPNACQTETTLSWPVAARTVMLGVAGGAGCSY